jgi:hypothetical protein
VFLSLLLPADTTLDLDTDFLGYNPKMQPSKLPTKKPKGKDLLGKQKRENGEISSYRIVDAIGDIKYCRIVKERFRIHKYGFDDTVTPITCVSLVTKAL